MGQGPRLLEAGRSAEALEWVRKPGWSAFGETDDRLTPKQVRPEARILEAMGDRGAAQTLRRRRFKARLSTKILRDYIHQLPDFEDIEPEAALHFFPDWPQLKLGAKLFIAHPHRWDGRDWHI